MRRWLISRFFLVFGSALILAGGSYLITPEVRGAILRQQGTLQNPTQLPSIPPQTLSKNFTLDRPSAVRLPRLAINVPLQEGEYSPTGQWPLNNTHAFYSRQTATPMIYGHAIEGIFLDLSGVAADELLELHTASQIFSFRYVKDELTNPDDVAMLAKHLPNTLLVITCVGQHFEQRRILQFAFIGAEESRQQ